MSDLLTRRLRRFHDRIAQVTEQKAPDAVAELATLYDRAGRAEKAYEFAMLAAEQARVRCAPSEGVEFLRIAERNAGSGAETNEVRIRLAHFAETAGRYDDALQACLQAIEWLQSRGERRRALPLLAMRERIRTLLGQPARQTLGTALTLDEEARALGATAERIPLLLLVSQSLGRMGDAAGAQRTAEETVKLAERAGDPALLADALNRQGVTYQDDKPREAIALYQRALAMYREAGDRRGEARGHNNSGIVHTRLAEWDAARREFTEAISIACKSSCPDMWGLAAMNLGVVEFRMGNHDRARELFGEALALFSAVQNQERQLFALYNLAHLEREDRQFESAAEFYDVAIALAQKVGHADIEIGAAAGAGLSLLESGRSDAAVAALERCADRARSRDGWFQGRELYEALRIRVQCARETGGEVVTELERVLERAEAIDPFGAAWLGAACAEPLAKIDRQRVRSLVDRLSERTRSLACPPLERRYVEVSARL